MLSRNKEYRFGFGGQERDNEIYGSGNSYTAEYWQYDSRLGRRWNVDPVVKHHESSYATFANNPIWFIDPFGADSMSVHQWNNSDGNVQTSSTMITDGRPGLQINGYDEISGKVINQFIPDINVTASKIDKSDQTANLTNYPKSSWYDRLHVWSKGNTYGEGEDWVNGGGFGGDLNIGVNKYYLGIKLETYSTTESNVGITFDLYFDVRISLSLDSKKGFGSTINAFTPKFGTKAYIYAESNTLSCKIKLNNAQDIYTQVEGGYGPLRIGANSNGKMIIGAGASSSSNLKADERLRTSLLKYKSPLINLQGN